MKKIVSTSVVIGMICIFNFVFAMHIMEGFLPRFWALVWTVISLPFVLYGLKRINQIVKHNRKAIILLAMSGAFAFVLSAMKIPSVTGSCSHPTGVGLGAILFGPTVMSVLGLIVLLFQALLLAHGGITTLGANVFSMAIIGPIVSFAVYKLTYKTTQNRSLAVFLAAALGNLLTYVTTSLQLGLAFPAIEGGFMASAAKFLSIFALTQVPLAIIEGLITVIIFNTIAEYGREELDSIHFQLEEVA